MSKNKVGINEYYDFVESVRPFLKKTLILDALDVEYGQWELPFEALILEMTKLPRNKIKFDDSLVKKLAMEADIIDDSVLDTDTWSKFLEWYNQPAT